MALKIRLQRGGATHAPHYRVVVAEAAARRDGRFVEKLGTYDPKNKDKSLQENLKLERIDYWLGIGAKPTDTVRSMIKRARRAAKDAPAVEATPAPAEEPIPVPAEEAPAVPAETEA